MYIYVTYVYKGTSILSPGILSSKLFNTYFTLLPLFFLTSSQKDYQKQIRIIVQLYFEWN